MPVNFDDYISTSLRWAMFKADWPDATVEFSEGTAGDAGIPSSFHKKDEKVCIATITRFVGDKRPMIGYKTLSDARSRDTDSWNVLCSKAMGRALKKAGYPDNMNDLKVWMRFREATGSATPAAPKQVQQVETKSVVAGVPLTQPQLPIESKEQPVKKPLMDWPNETEREEAHRLFKQSCSDLSPDDLEALRDAHEKLNNRAWPMPKAELNTLIITLEGIRTNKKESGTISIDAVKSMYEFSSPRIQEIVREKLGDPTAWPAELSEAEYDQMVTVFEAASEAE